MKKILLPILCAFAFSLNSQVKVESSIDEYYDGSTWTKNYGSDYYYDANKNLIKESNYEWTGSDWSPNYITLCSYNMNNLVTEEIEMGWDGVSQFTNLDKTTYTYFSSGLLANIVTQEWDGSAWQNFDKQSFTYEFGVLEMIEYAGYDGTQWEVESRFLTTYTGNNLTTLVTEELNGTQWESEDRIMFFYNSANKMTYSSFESYDGSSWSQDYKIDYTLDNNFNLIKKSLSFPGTEEFYAEYEYDLTGQMANIANPFSYLRGLESILEDFPYTNKILNYTGNQYDDVTNSFYPTERTTFNYTSQLVLNLDEAKASPNISLYPNPANNFIQINGITKSENISVYTVLGVKVFDAVVNKDDKLDIQGLNNGLYLLKFENGTALKFLKK
ncbi:T9SS type A sorting domain-containing protein [Brumimicrobium glaciale]|uniref:T9SS type A sorting domain-containing protein n=1 Tax=Brumimicrobium glaciale TaxID=200475 RepID=A0A4Q4KRE7_9FLAO|nr:T9SS type A sorting domain-containing protein [Brumimicrobium glaciale]RYM34579.1 T9SS type A sorting domain-containing protein [Brumimicrobium glaciale]